MGVKDCRERMFVRIDCFPLVFAILVRDKYTMLKKILFIGLVLLTLSSCGLFDFQKEANATFDDQYFKWAIANIELYNVRYGHYPEALGDLTFLGDFDKVIYSTVSYEKLDTGYRLDIIKKLNLGSVTSLEYPEEFWQGLGIKESNLLNNKQ